MKKQTPKSIWGRGDCGRDNFSRSKNDKISYSSSSNYNRRLIFGICCMYLCTIWIISLNYIFFYVAIFCHLSWIMYLVRLANLLWKSNESYFLWWIKTDPERFLGRLWNEDQTSSTLATSEVNSFTMYLLCTFENRPTWNSDTSRDASSTISGESTTTTLNQNLGSYTARLRYTRRLQYALGFKWKKFIGRWNTRF